ncbi:MAG: branched-chain amino acid ABC transporter permease [Alphaproteobacteria bacterium]|nr:branched-chain amino acid ABC transporter permease [Alphaproteobacteria bacterium]
MRPASLSSPSNLAAALILVLLALLPLFAELLASPFLVTLFTRMLIYAIAATSLNLILGYGGMVSFGHAMYIGIGGYVVGIMASHGVHAGWLQWPLAIAISALFALVIGALCLRTRGVYFIMITLAFAQMVYFMGVGLEEYGGDDGLTIYNRSSFGSLLNLSDKRVFYYVCLVLLVGALYLVHRLVQSRFGMVLRGSRSNDRRMQAIGFPTYRYRLTGFVIAGMICGLSGALMANHNEFVSPAMMHWVQSGDLIVMVVLGGMGTATGPLFGALAFLLVEYLLSRITEYWQIIFGPLLILVVLFARGGIGSLFDMLEGRRRG